MTKNVEEIRRSLHICVLLTTALICGGGNELHVQAFSAIDGLGATLPISRTVSSGGRPNHQRAVGTRHLPNIPDISSDGRLVAPYNLFQMSMSSVVSPSATSEEAILDAAVMIPLPASRISLTTPQSSELPSSISAPSSSASSSTSAKNSSLSSAAKWHQNRRKAMLSKYAKDIIPLEQSSHGLFIGLPLLILSNAALTFMSIKSATWSIPKIILLSFFPGSIFSLWQLQILHDALHGSLLPKSTPSSSTSSTDITDDNKQNRWRRKLDWKNLRMAKYIMKNRNSLHQKILFWGSMPSAFGYYLYLHFGHLTHHKSFGDPTKASLATLFNSKNKNFEDGDVLFVNHRMKLKGEIGPTLPIPQPLHTLTNTTSITISIGKTGLDNWKKNNHIYNSCIYTTSLLFERALLVLNDVVVALTGRNHFFPHKPTRTFHNPCATYCRHAVTVRAALCLLTRSLRPLLFLYLAETLWSLPPHPACAMFVTNHGSDPGGGEEEGGCVPSASVYAGRWYSVMTLGTNYHVEHHDFPGVPLHRLGRMRGIAPEFYRGGSGDGVWDVMRGAFREPDFYACMDATIN